MKLEKECTAEEMQMEVVRLRRKYSSQVSVCCNECGVAEERLHQGKQSGDDDDDVSFYNSTASTWTLATPRTNWETTWERQGKIQIPTGKKRETLPRTCVCKFSNAQQTEEPCSIWVYQLSLIDPRSGNFHMPGKQSTKHGFSTDSRRDAEYQHEQTSCRSVHKSKVLDVQSSEKAHGLIL